MPFFAVPSTLHTTASSHATVSEPILRDASLAAGPADARMGGGEGGETLGVHPV